MSISKERLERLLIAVDESKLPSCDDITIPYSKAWFTLNIKTALANVTNEKELEEIADGLGRLLFELRI